MTAPIPATSPLFTAPARPESPPARTATRRPDPAARPDGPGALPPVETVPRGLDLRFEDAQGRPTGPPPAFKVSLLAALREALLRQRPDGIAPSRVRLPEVEAPVRIDRRM